MVVFKRTFFLFILYVTIQNIPNHIQAFWDEAITYCPVVEHIKTEDRKFSVKFIPQSFHARFSQCKDAFKKCFVSICKTYIPHFFDKFYIATEERIDTKIKEANETLHTVIETEKEPLKNKISLFNTTLKNVEEKQKKQKQFVASSMLTLKKFEGLQERADRASQTVQTSIENIDKATKTINLVAGLLNILHKK